MLQALRAGAHRALGFASFSEYIGRLFDYTPRWTAERLRVTGVQRSSLPSGHPRAHMQLTAVHSAYADR